MVDIENILARAKEIVSKRNINRNFDVSKIMISKRYAYKEEKVYDDVVDRILGVLPADDYRTKFLNFAMKSLWIVGATPELSNLNTDRGLPISCFKTKVPDDMGGIIGNFSDVAALGSLGGGVGIDLTDVAGLGEEIKNGTTAGTVPFIQVYNALTSAISQGSLRRASMVINSKVSHPDILDFINMRNPNGGDMDRKALKLHHCVDFDDAFMEAVVKNEDFEIKSIRTNKTIAKYPAYKFLTEYFDINTETGEPFALFSGNTKINRSDIYEALDIHVTSTNLCFTGDMMLLTDKGYVSFKDLYENDEELTVLSDIRADNAECLNPDLDFKNPIKNESFSKLLSETTSAGKAFITSKEVVHRNASKVHLTQKDADIYEVTLNNGTSIKCTLNHKFYVFRDRKRLMKIPLNEVKVGDSVFLQSGKGSFGSNGNYTEGYLLGAMFGDGYLLTTEQAKEKELANSANVFRLKFWNEKPEFIESIDCLLESFCKTTKIKTPHHKEYEYNGNNINEYNSSGMAIYFKEKYKVFSKKDVDFLYTLSEDAFIGFFKGFMDADGTGYKTVYDKSTGKFTFGVQVCQVNHDLLKVIQVILQNFGITTNIHLNSKGGTFDDKRMEKSYNTNPLYRMDISQKSVERIIDMFGSVFTISQKEDKITRYKVERDTLFDNVPCRNDQNLTKIKSIEFVGKEDVYDCTQYDTHSLIVNGVAVGNCTEILQEHNKDLIASCCLASYNLEFFEEFEEFLDILVESTAFYLHHVMLETVRMCDIFSEKKPEYKPTLDKVKRSIEKDHSIGMGFMGYHTGMQKNSIPFESPMAVGYTRKVTTKFRAAADKANDSLATEFGPCGNGIAANINALFSNMFAIAPTSSISVIAGCPSPGIDLDQGVCYNLQQEDGSHEIKNPYFAKVLEAYSKANSLNDTWEADQWRSIRKNRGSVQHLDWLSKHDKDVYKTSFETDQNYVIELAAVRQKILKDQAQSLNIFLKASCHKQEILNLFVKAWALGVKTIYYRRMRQDLSTGTNEGGVTAEMTDEEVRLLEARETYKYAECLNCQ